MPVSPKPTRREQPDSLLELLMESEARATRLDAFERLAGLGPAIAPRVAERLSDERWYVQRNMLALLAELGRVPDGFDPQPFASHADPRVRREAFRLWLTLPGERERALGTAFADPDERVVRIALAATPEGCPESAVPALLRRIGDRALTSDLHAHAIRRLKGVRSPGVPELLLELTDGGRSLFGRPRLPPKSPRLLAALEVLAQSWRTEPKAAAVLALAARSKDPEIRRAAEAREPVPAEPNSDSEAEPVPVAAGDAAFGEAT